ncbi:PucR family transcriptional regulator [Aneurinibacillus sp. REN35]|uniref:PucR family transcriptional regulator n=1 Tax=Aneurinibacillus sp. REN35 TaxID=3237286 RepID=UPI00352759DB
MNFTVKDVMNLEIMKPGRVLTAPSAMSKRPVESVSVIEIPVENFILKNELVLTTAIGCSEDIHVFKHFVQDIVESGAAALAIATGRHVISIPEEITAYAEEQRFPIIEIPWEIRFSDITHTLLSHLNHWQQTTLQRSEELQKQLLNLFLHDASLSDATELISQTIGSPVLIVDKNGHIKGSSQQASSLAKKWEEQAKTYLTSHIPNAVRYTEESINWVHFVDDAIVQLEIKTANKVHGYLLLALSSTYSLQTFQENEEEYILERAITIAALWFQREHAILETEFRLKDDFIWSLAKGEIDSWDTAISRAKSLNYNVMRPYVCILGAPENLESLFQQNNSMQLSYEQWTQTIVHSIEEQLISAGEAMQRLTMTTYHQDRFIIFLEISMDNINEIVTAYLDRVDDRLNELAPGLLISWGIGENHAGERTFMESFNDARIALEVGTRQKGPGYRSTYANTEIYRALSSLADNTKMQEITLSTIGALIDYDQQRGLDLIHTLNTYIRNQGNVSQTARVLSLHRQSLLYRLRKIESLTQRSLVDPDDLFLLDLSSRLWTTGLLAATMNSSSYE